jgi:hypothetical protein
VDNSDDFDNGRLDAVDDTVVSGNHLAQIFSAILLHDAAGIRKALKPPRATKDAIDDVSGVDY